MRSGNYKTGPYGESIIHSFSNDDKGYEFDDIDNYQENRGRKASPTPQYRNYDKKPVLFDDFSSFIERISDLEKKISDYHPMPPVVKTKVRRKKKAGKSRRSSPRRSRSPRTRAITKSEYESNNTFQPIVAESKHGNAGVISFKNQNVDYKGYSWETEKSLKNKRPSSAPSSKRPFPHSRRAELNKYVVAAGEKGENLDDDDQEKLKREEYDSKYTYDMKSGRRILKIHADMYGMSPNRIKDKADEDANNGNITHRSTASSQGPTKAEWPGPRTSKSVNRWLEKVKQARESDQNDAANYSYLQPRMLNAYKYLKDSDILITIEHCHNCEFHNMSLRHDHTEYIANADMTLRQLCETIHEYNAAVRVGVLRFRANITPKSKQTDFDSRIGAFEVQIAYKPINGDLVVKVLHSKLASRLWPGRAFLQRSLVSFLQSESVPVFPAAPVPSADEALNMDYGVEGIAPYPLGVSPWESISLSQPDWKFPIVKENQNSSNQEKLTNPSNPKHVMLNNFIANKGNNVSETPPETKESPRHLSSPRASTAGNPLYNVLWVFDSCVANFKPKFKLGEEVCFYNLKRPGSDTVERYPKFGTVVKSWYDQSKKMRMCVARLRYIDVEVPHPEDLTIRSSEYVNRKLQFTTDSMVPIEVDVVFSFGFKYQLFRWMVETEDDKEVFNYDGTKTVYLCRSSLFNQLRDLVFNIESIFIKASKENSVKSFINGDHKVLHEKSGVWVDLQAVYSEEDLDWIQNKFGNIVNTRDLLAITSQQLPLSVPHTAAPLRSTSLRSSFHLKTQDVEDSHQKPPMSTPRLSAGAAVVAEFASKAMDKISLTGASTGEAMSTASRRSSTNVNSTDVPTASTTIRQSLVDNIIAATAHEISDFITATSQHNLEHEENKDDDVTDPAVVEQEIAVPVITFVAEAFRNALREVCNRIHTAIVESGDVVSGSPRTKEKKSLKLLYKNISKDHSGFIHVSDLMVVLESFGIKANATQQDAILAAFDLDGDRRVSFEEFIDFIHHHREIGKRELGEIWITLQEGIRPAAASSNEYNYDDEDDDLPTLEDLEDIFENRQNVRQTGPGVVTEFVFRDIIKNSNFSLSESDILSLLEAFGMKVKDPNSNHKTHNCFRFTDFLCWLQPVDVSRVCKRIGRFVKAVVNHERVLDNDSIEKISDVLNKLNQEYAHGILKDDFLNICEKLHLPISTAEIRALYRHIDKGEKNDVAFQDFQHILSGYLPEEAPNHPQDPSMTETKASVLHSIIGQEYAVDQPLHHESNNYNNNVYDHIPAVETMKTESVGRDYEEDFLEGDVDLTAANPFFSSSNENGIGAYSAANPLLGDMSSQQEPLIYYDTANIATSSVNITNQNTGTSAPFEYDPDISAADFYSSSPANSAPYQFQFTNQSASSTDDFSTPFSLPEFRNKADTASSNDIIHDNIAEQLKESSDSESDDDREAELDDNNQTFQGPADGNSNLNSLFQGFNTIGFSSISSQPVQTGMNTNSEPTETFGENTGYVEKEGDEDEDEDEDGYDDNSVKDSPRNAAYDNAIISNSLVGQEAAVSGADHDMLKDDEPPKSQRNSFQKPKLSLELGKTSNYNETSDYDAPAYFNNEKSAMMYSLPLAALPTPASIAQSEFTAGSGGYSEDFDDRDEGDVEVEEADKEGEDGVARDAQDSESSQSEENQNVNEDEPSNTTKVTSTEVSAPLKLTINTFNTSLRNMARQQAGTSSSVYGNDQEGFQNDATDDNEYSVEPELYEGDDFEQDTPTHVRHEIGFQGNTNIEYQVPTAQHDLRFEFQAQNNQQLQLPRPYDEDEDANHYDGEEAEEEEQPESNYEEFASPQVRESQDAGEARPEFPASSADNYDDDSFGSNQDDPENDSPNVRDNPGNSNFDLMSGAVDAENRSEGNGEDEDYENAYDDDDFDREQSGSRSLADADAEGDIDNLNAEENGSADGYEGELSSSHSNQNYGYTNQSHSTLPSESHDIIPPHSDYDKTLLSSASKPSEQSLIGAATASVPNVSTSPPEKPARHIKWGDDETKVVAVIEAEYYPHNPEGTYALDEDSENDEEMDENTKQNAKTQHDDDDDDDDDDDGDESLERAHLDTVQQPPADSLKQQDSYEDESGEQITRDEVDITDPKSIAEASETSPVEKKKSELILEIDDERDDSNLMNQLQVVLVRAFDLPNMNGAAPSTFIYFHLPGQTKQVTDTVLNSNDPEFNMISSLPMLTNGEQLRILSDFVLQFNIMFDTKEYDNGDLEAGFDGIMGSAKIALSPLANGNKLSEYLDIIDKNEKYSGQLKVEVYWKNDLHGYKSSSILLEEDIYSLFKAFSNSKDEYVIDYDVFARFVLPEDSIIRSVQALRLYLRVNICIKSTSAYELLEALFPISGAIDEETFIDGMLSLKLEILKEEWEYIFFVIDRAGREVIAISDILCLVGVDNGMSSVLLDKLIDQGSDLRSRDISDLDDIFSVSDDSYYISRRDFVSLLKDMGFQVPSDIAYDYASSPSERSATSDVAAQNYYDDHIIPKNLEREGQQVLSSEDMPVVNGSMPDFGGAYGGASGTHKYNDDGNYSRGISGQSFDEAEDAEEEDEDYVSPQSESGAGARHMAEAFASDSSANYEVDYGGNRDTILQGEGLKEPEYGDDDQDLYDFDEVDAPKGVIESDDVHIQSDRDNIGDDQFEQHEENETGENDNNEEFNSAEEALPPLKDEPQSSKDEEENGGEENGEDDWDKAEEEALPRLKDEAQSSKDEEENGGEENGEDDWDKAEEEALPSKDEAHSSKDEEENGGEENGEDDWDKAEEEALPSKDEAHSSKDEEENGGEENGEDDWDKAEEEALPSKDEAHSSMDEEENGGEENGKSKEDMNVGGGIYGGDDKHDENSQDDDYYLHAKEGSQSPTGDDREEHDLREEQENGSGKASREEVEEEVDQGPDDGDQAPYGEDDFEDDGNNEEEENSEEKEEIDGKEISSSGLNVSSGFQKGYSQPSDAGDAEAEDTYDDEDDERFEDDSDDQ